MRKASARQRRSKASARSIKGAETSHRALGLRKQGYTYEEIGDALKCSIEGARKACLRQYEELNKANREEAKEQRDLQGQRLDAMLRAIWPKIKRGDLGAVEKGVKILARYSALFGLDAPTKNEVTGKDGKPIELTQTYLDIVRSAKDDPNNE